mgnify:FL=1
MVLMNDNPESSLYNRILSLMKERGFDSLTEPQRLAIPEILKGNNVLLTSPTGSGKTEAAVLPAMVMLDEMKDSITGFGIIYVTPLRALNRDVMGRIESYGRSIGLDVSVRHGDSSESERRYQALNPPDVLITTPETLQIILNGKILRKHLSSLKFLIIDEVHELLNDERGWQLLVAISRIREIAKDFKIISISATVGNPEEVARAIFYGYDYKIINAGVLKEYDIKISMPIGAPENFKEIIGAEDNYSEVIYYLLKLYKTGRQFIAFTNTRSTAEDIVMRLRLFDKDILVDVHHGSLGKEVRTKIEEDFKKGKLKGLVCTSSMELGIDIGTVDFVVQVNSPRQVIRLVQRIGRGRHRLGEVSEGEVICVNEIETEEASVIGYFAQNGKIENIEIRKNPTIVLVNQIISMVYAEREISIDRAFSIFRRSYIFRDLSLDSFYLLLEFLNSVRIIYLDLEGKIIRRSARTMKYFLENVSMIPDEKRFVVRESSTGKIIGFLDEVYVATELDVGSTFILKGSTWRVLRIKDDFIYVDYIQGISVPPSWSGEEIPVPYEIAMEVGRRRRKRIIGKNLSEHSSELLRKFVEDTASDQKIIVEKEGNVSVIQLTGGTKLNYTIALIITFTLSEKYGESFLFDISPYHIMIQGNYRYSGEEIVDTISNAGLYLDNMDRFVEKTRIFTYNFINVAKKFGVISRDTDFTRIRMDKIISIYKDTSLYKEALEKFKWDYLQLDKAKDIIKAIEEGKIEIIQRNRFSDSSKIYMTNLKEKMMPIKPTGPILNAIKKRLQSEEMGFYCLSCKRSFTSKISEMKEKRCIFCSSPRIAPFKTYDYEAIQEMSQETQRKLNVSYHLLRMYEDKALLVMAAHGIGPETASRILQIPVKNENELLERILQNEVEFAKNRRFWE